jgi:hypothetical protein
MKAQRLQREGDLEAWSQSQESAVMGLLNQLFPPEASVKAFSMPAEHSRCVSLVLPSTAISKQALLHQEVKFTLQGPSLFFGVLCMTSVQHTYHI